MAKKLRALKYGVANFDEDSIIKSEKLKILQSKIKDNPITIKLDHDTQKNYMKETRIKEKSYFTISEEELQKTVTDQYGTGKICTTGTGQIKETISYDRDIGIIVSAKGVTENNTNKFTIHYSKKRTHVVPVRRDNNVWFRGLFV